MATGPGEKLLVEHRRPVRNWTRRTISSLFLCRKLHLFLGKSTKTAAIRAALFDASVHQMGNSIKLVNSVKLLGVQLSAYKNFRIDIGYMKSKFYRAFNGLFHNAAKLKDELTTMHLVSSCCRPNHACYTAQKLWL